MEYLGEDRQKKIENEFSFLRAFSGKGTAQKDTQHQLLSEVIGNAKNAQYSGDIVHPEETIEFPQGTVKKYLFDENATLYLWFSNDHHYNLQGILRYEVKNVKQTAEQVQELTRNALLQGKTVSVGREYYLPRSIDEITTEIIGSTKRRAEFKSADAELVYDTSDAPLTPAQEFVLKQGGCGHTFELNTDWNLMTLLTVNATTLTCGSILSGMYTSIIPLMASVSLGLLSGGWFLYSCIVPKESTVQTIPGLVPKLRNQIKNLEQITAAYNTAADINACVKLSKEMSAQKEKLGYYWHALYTSLTQKCVSFTYTNDSAEKVLDYFSQLRRKMKKNSVILAETKTETKLKPVPTLDEITLEQKWKKDENYGRRIDGRYELREFLGEGGMGKVYRAVAILDGKEAAIKFEKPETSALKKKEKLIKLLCGLKHENLVATTDANLDNQPAYAVMDLIDGADLGKILEFARENKETKQHLSLENALSVARDIGEALHFLHSNGSRKIIHNDIKPSNILIDENGKAYLGDCDIADIERDMNSLLTGTTSQKASGAGTIEYMAPERRGIVKAKVSERSDIYSFGAVLYELIAGQLPMTPNGLDKRTDLPEDLRQILCKCVAIQPEDRYQTMKEALEDLNKLSIESKPIQLIISGREQRPEAFIAEKKELPRQNTPDADLIEKIQEGLSSGRLSVQSAMDAAHLTMEDVLRANPGLMDEQSQKEFLDASNKLLAEEEEPDPNELFNSAELPSAAELKEEEESEPLISPEELDSEEGEEKARKKYE